MPRGPAVLSVFDVEPRFIGGTETYARELSLQLDRHGWRSILCFATAPTDHVRRFLDLANIRLETVESSAGVARPLAQLARVLGRYRPQIVHLHYTALLSAYPWLARLLSAKQVFFTDHASRPMHYSSAPAPALKRWVARGVSWPLSRVICVSAYGERSAIGHGLIPAARTTMIYNGVDLSRVTESAERAAAFRARFSIPAERRIVSQISWIIPEKGIPDLLAAAGIVVSRHPDVHFVIVGDGPYRSQYEKAAVDLGLQGRMTWTGLIEDPFEAGVYDAADVVCQVSRWEEIFGWVIAEAMAYRRPVIATRVGGIPELVGDAETGYLIDRGDVDALADRILKLIEDPVRRKAMGHAARAKVDARFDLRKNVARLLEVYGITSGTGRREPLR